jgi:hypothetical protein
MSERFNKVSLLLCFKGREVVKFEWRLFGNKKATLREKERERES